MANTDESSNDFANFDINTLLSFKDYNYFKGVIKPASKGVISNICKFVLQLAPQYGYGKFINPLHYLSFLIPLSDKLKLTNELNIFTDDKFIEDPKRRCLFLIFLLFCMNPENKILPPFLNFSNNSSKNLILHLIDQDPSSFITKKAEKLQNDSERGIIFDSRIAQISDFYEKERAKNKVIGNKNYSQLSIDPKNSIRTCTFRTFFKSDKIISNLTDIITLFEISLDKQEMQIFSELKITTQNLLLIHQLKSTKNYLLILRTVKVVTKESERSYNIVSVDASYKSSDRLIFIEYSDMTENISFTVLEEEFSDDKINYKLYQDNRFSVMDSKTIMTEEFDLLSKKTQDKISALKVSSSSDLITDKTEGAEVVQSEIKHITVDPLSLKSFSEFSNKEEYFFYDNITSELNNSLMRSDVMFKFDSVEKLIENLFFIMGLVHKPFTNLITGMIDNSSPFLTLMKMVKLIKFLKYKHCFNILFSDDTADIGNKIIINRFLQIANSKSNTHKYILIRNKYVSEIYLDSRKFDYKVIFSRDSLFYNANNFENDPLFLGLNSLTKIYNDSSISEFVVSVKLDEDEKEYEKCINFIRNNFHMIDINYEFRDIEKYLNDFFSVDLQTYLSAIFESKDNYQLTHSIREFVEKRRIGQLTNLQRSFLLDISDMRYNYAHPNLSSGANISSFIQRFFIDINRTDFLKIDNDVREAPLDYLINNLTRNSVIVDFALLIFDENMLPSGKIVMTIRSVNFVGKNMMNCSLFGYNSNKKMIYYLVPNTRGNISFNVSFVENFNMIQSDMINNKIAEIDKNVFADLSFLDKNRINFFNVYRNNFNPVLTNLELKISLMKYDMYLRSIGKPMTYVNVLKKQSDSEMTTTSINETEDKILNLKKLTSNFTEFFNNITSTALKEFWFSYAKKDEFNQSVFDFMVTVCNEKEIITHPVKSIEKCLSEMREYLNVTLKQDIEKLEKSILNMNKILDHQIISEKSVSKTVQSFDNKIEKIKEYLNTNDLKPNLNRLKGYLSNELNIYKFIHETEHVLYKEQKYVKKIFSNKEVSLVDSLTNYNNILSTYLERCSKNLEDDLCSSFEVESLEKNINDDKELSRFNMNRNEIMVLSDLISDFNFLKFANLNNMFLEQINLANNNISQLFDIDRYVNLTNIFFTTINDSIQKNKFRSNYTESMNNFMTWTRLRHDLLGKITLTELFPEFSNVDLDCSFGHFFSNMSRTPDFLIFNENKTKFLVMEFTYSHKETKGFLAKGNKLSNSKYYPEIYRIYNSTEIEEIFYLPVVFSQYMEDKQYSSFGVYEKAFQRLETEGFPVSSKNIQNWKDKVSSITKLFLTSTNLIYRPDKLFNHLIAYRNKEQIYIGNKYNCVEYNAELVDEIFESKPDQRIMLHLIFGKYLHLKFSVSDIVLSIHKYNLDPIFVGRDFDDIFDSEIGQPKMLLYDLNEIFNKSLSSFDKDDCSKIYMKRMNFFDEFFKRVTYFMRKLEPPYMPSFSIDASFILNSYYYELFSGDSMTPTLSSLVRYRPAIIRLPHNDITKYFVDSTRIINYNPPVFTIQKFDCNIDEMKAAVGSLKDFLNEVLENCEIQEFNYLITMMHNLSIYEAEEIQKNKKHVREFFKDYSSKIQSISDFPRLINSKIESLKRDLFEENLKNCVINIYKNTQNLYIFEDLKSMVVSLLIKNDLLISQLSDSGDTILTITDPKFESEIKQKEKEKILVQWGKNPFSKANNEKLSELIEREELSIILDPEPPEEDTTEIEEQELNLESEKLIENLEKFDRESSNIQELNSKIREILEKIEMKNNFFKNNRHQSSLQHNKLLTYYKESDLTKILSENQAYRGDLEPSEFSEYMIRDTSDSSHTQEISETTIVNYKKEFVVKSLELDEESQRNIYQKIKENRFIWTSNEVEDSVLEDSDFLISRELLEENLMTLSFWSKTLWRIKITTIAKLLERLCLIRKQLSLKRFDDLNQIDSNISYSERTIVTNSFNLFKFIKRNRIIDNKTSSDALSHGKIFKISPKKAVSIDPKITSLILKTHSEFVVSIFNSMNTASLGFFMFNFNSEETDNLFKIISIYDNKFINILSETFDIEPVLYISYKQSYLFAKFRNTRNLSKEELDKHKISMIEKYSMKELSNVSELLISVNAAEEYGTTLDDFNDLDISAALVENSQKQDELFEEEIENIMIEDDDEFDF
jgi:hypothetical protein